MRPDSYHAEALAHMKANPDGKFTPEDMAAALGHMDAKKSMSSVLRELYLVHTPFVHRQKLKMQERQRQNYYWFDDTKHNGAYNGDDYPRPANAAQPIVDDEPVEQKYLDAVDAMIKGLGDSDYVLHCGELAVRNLSTYREDLARDLQTKLAA